MVSARVRRLQVAFARERGLSCRRACALLKTTRSSLGYESRKELRDAELVVRLRALALRHPKYGYRFIHERLRRQGVKVNAKRVYRLWRLHALGLPRRRINKRIRKGMRRHVVAAAPNHVWACDFVSDSMEDHKKLRCLTLVDESTRECLAIEVQRRLRSTDVVRVLDQLVRRYGAPRHLRSDNGTEFKAARVDRWLKAHNVVPLYSDPGSPWQNGLVESFNGRFRDECLNAESFATLREAQLLVETWRREYNEQRPHSSLEYRTPAEVGACRALPPSANQSAANQRMARVA